MKKILTIYLLFITASFIGQDTLYQTNSNDYGYTQTYIFHKNGEFIYLSECNCTGFKTCGAGYYSSEKKHISLRYDSTLADSHTFTCNINITAGPDKLIKKKDEYLNIVKYTFEKENPNKPWKTRKVKAKSKFIFRMKN